MPARTSQSIGQRGLQVGHAGGCHPEGRDATRIEDAQDHLRMKPRQRGPLDTQVFAMQPKAPAAPMAASAASAASAAKAATSITTVKNPGVGLEPRRFGEFRQRLPRPPESRSGVGYGNRRHHRVFQTFEPGRVGQPFRGAIFLQVGAPRQVRLAPRLQPGDPAPSEGVARGIGVEQMSVEEVGPQRPGQALDVDPIPGPPHPGVVVEVTRLDQFPGEAIHHRDAPATGHDRLGPLEHGRIGLLAQPVHLGSVAGPDFRPQLEPALPVIAPHQFLRELLHGLEAMGFEQRAHQLFGGHQARPDGRRQPRHVGVARDHPIAQRPVPRGPRQECPPTGEGRLARRRKQGLGAVHRRPRWP